MFKLNSKLIICPKVEFSFSLSSEQQKKIPYQYELGGCKKQFSQNWGNWSIILCRINPALHVPVTPHIHYLITASQQGTREDKLMFSPFDRGDTEAANDCLTHPSSYSLAGPACQCRSFLIYSPAHVTLHTMLLMVGCMGFHPRRASPSSNQTLQHPKTT